MDFSITVFWSICKVIYNLGGKFSKKNKNKQKKKKKKKKNTFFTSKSDLNVIFGQVLVRMWRLWSTRLINTQKVERS